MRAAVCRAYGPPEVVRVEDLDLAAPSTEGQVLVDVRAASVNFPDVLIVADEYQISVPLPFVPGSELAGVVVEGPGAGFSVGDRVFGTLMVGAFAEQAWVPASALTPIPDEVDYRAAAAFGVAHRTAYHVLRSVARVEAGDRVIVLGAGGGVGLAAVQLASVLGAEVIAVASSDEKLAAALSLGATAVVNHRQGDLRQALRQVVGEGADAVVDPVGGDLSEAALRALRWGGRFVTVGYASGAIPRIPLNLVLLKGVTVAGFEFRSFAVNCTDELRRNDAELMGLLAEGRAMPHIGASFGLEEAAAALRYVADGRAVGKVVIDMAGG